MTENLGIANQSIATAEKILTKRVLWKFDLYILPPLALLWLANFIDRSNIGNARIAGLERDTHLQGNQFNVALTVFYASYIIVELPSNWVIKKVKPNRWLPILICTWGTVTTLSGLVQDFAGLTAVRVVLGFCEGGLLPGMILYLSTIYKRQELQLRVGIFYASASLSGAFGGLLATAILKMEGVGGLAGWRWIFILEGIGSVVCGFIAAIFLPAGIQSARFLTEEERQFALNRFRRSDATAASAPTPEPAADVEKKGADVVEVEEEQPKEVAVFQEDEQFEWGEVIRGFKDIQVWLTAFAYLGIIVGLYSYSLFLPTIVAGLGYGGYQAQLHTVPPYVPAAVLTVVVAYLSDRLGWRGIFILICMPVTIVGYIVAITAQTNQGRYAAVFLMAAGVYPSGPCILSILPNNSSGHYKKATTTALQLAVANTGGFIATWAYTADQAPRYVRGHSIALAFACFAWILVAANVIYCVLENKARRTGRRQSNIDRYRELWQSGKTRAPIGDRHPDFLFTL
ncbi:MFS general substrate transporter [Heliocybe sulcata]|uniref:MFS general substrate transporter n=1 Tax=Heliocybe sulcata TaxID=5364 RepID=A0A5C3NHM9_9AGAM|nr:MFS general substrate transporter [Heliocybe sulcata]